jgi:hypothetical protein
MSAARANAGDAQKASSRCSGCVEPDATAVRPALINLAELGAGVLSSLWFGPGI